MGKKTVNKPLEEVYTEIKTSEQARKMGLYLLNASHAFIMLAEKLKEDETKVESSKTPLDEGQGVEFP